MLESFINPNRSSITRWIKFSRGCALAALFFSPWMMQWVIPIVGLDQTAVSSNIPKLRLADVLAALSVASYALGGWPGLRGVLRQRRLWCWSVAGLLVWSVMSAVWAVRPALALVFGVHVALWVLLAVRVACDDLPPRSIALSLLAGLLINSMVGLAQFFLQRSLGLDFLGELALDPGVAGASVIGSDAAHLLRLYGLSGHPNVIGGFAAVALVWGLALIARSSRRWLPVMLGAWLLGWLTLLLAFSRSAWLGMALALGLIAAVVWWRRAYRRYARRLAALAAIILIPTTLLYIWLQPFMTERLSAPASSALESASIDERLDLMQVSMKLIKLQPFTGVGIGNFIAANQALLGAVLERDWVHNVPLLIASELGMTGLFMWLIGLAALAYHIWRRYRRGQLDVWLVVAVSSIVIMLVVSLFDHYWWTSSQGVYVWAVITGWVVSRGME